MDKRYLVAMQITGLVLVFVGVASFSVAMACVVLGATLVAIGETR